MQRRDQSPGLFAWLVAFVSFLLPWAGCAAVLAGLWQVSRGENGGWWLVAAGGAMLIADVLIDFVWAHPSVLGTDQPDLNRRSMQLLGRVATVEEAIDCGRGRVRIGDTLWMAEGPDMPAGAEVRITAANGSVLKVERV